MMRTYTREDLAAVLDVVNDAARPMPASSPLVASTTHT
jgi:hypothetical protein